MVVIRLARFGKKHAPHYRITVADSKRYVTGKYIELLGTYNPMIKQNQVKIDLEKYQGWVKKGAQPTDRVRHIVKLASK
jgi:small subunit ribosomal protein S16